MGTTTAGSDEQGLASFRYWLLGDMKNGVAGASSIESPTIETMSEHYFLSALLQE